MKLARLGARISIFFLLATQQAIHTINRANTLFFTSINPSDIKSDRLGVRISEPCLIERCDGLLVKGRIWVSVI